METVKDRVAARIATALSADPADLNLSFEDQADLLATPVAGRTVAVQPTGISDKMSMSVRVYEGDVIIAQGVARVSVQVQRDVVIARTTLARGVQTRADMLETDRQWLPPTAQPATVAQAVGAVVRGRVEAGRVLMAKDVEAPIIIKKGDLVSVDCVAGTVVVGTTARAKENGCDGQVIEFQPLQSKKTFLARINGTGKAVLVLRYEPRDKDGNSIFSKSKAWSQFATFAAKAKLAKKRGAVTYNNAMVVAEVGAEVADRQMKYNQVLLGALRGYSQPGVASWALGVQIYPAASQNIPVAKDIGIVARYSDSLVFESKTGDGSQTAKGKWTKYAVGVRGRIAVGDKPASPLIGIEGMYGSSKYDFAGTDQVVLELPSVNYTFIRAGADARVPFGPAALTVGAGYINVMSGGKLGDQFPKAKFSGVDAKIGVSYAFISWLEARALFTYTRIGMKANPDVTSDPFIAGGAIDQYFVGNIGISALF